MLWLTFWRLKSADAEIRAAAAGTLAAAPNNERIAAALLKALDDPDTRVRRVAAKAMCARHDRRAVVPLIERLRSSAYESERQTIVDALDGIAADWLTTAARDLVPWMVAALKGCSAVILQVLDRVDPEWTRTDAARGAIPSLTAMLGDGRAEIREFAEGVLLRIDPQWNRLESARDCVPVFTRWLHGEFSDLRDAALGMLVKIPDSRATEALIMLLPHPESKVREAAERALKCIHPEWPSSPAARAAIPALEAVLDAAHWRRTLGRPDDDAGTKRVDQVLSRIWAALDAAHDKAWTERAAQVQSRIEAPAEESTTADEAAAHDRPRNDASASPAPTDHEERTPKIGALIAAFVEGATASAREATARRWRHIDADWVRSQDARAALRTLRHIDPEWARSPDARTALPYLVLALAHRDESCRRVALQVLESIDPEWWRSDAAFVSVTSLAEVLGSDDEERRSHAQQVLERIDSEWWTSEAARNAMPALIAAVPSNWTVREHLDRIDAGWKERELTKRVLIVQLVEGATPRAREKAAKLLKHIDPEWPRSPDARAALPYLAPALAHPEDSRRRIALQVLESIDPEWKSDSARAAIAALAEGLGSDDKERRNHAQQALERIDSEWWKSEAARSAVPALIAALPSRRTVRGHLDRIDAGWRGCEFAKRLVQQFVAKLEEPARSFEHILRVLADLEWQPETARHEAYFHFARRDWEALRRLGGPAIEPLDRACRAGCLSESQGSVFDSSVRLLAEIAGADAIDPLLHLLFRETQEFFPAEISRALHALVPVSPLTRETVDCIVVASTCRFPHDFDKARADSDAAIASLCSLDCAVTSNVLRLVTGKNDVQVALPAPHPLYRDPDDYGGGYRTLSLAEQRQTAWRELRRRGYPPYDPAAYRNS